MLKNELGTDVTENLMKYLIHITLVFVSIFGVSHSVFAAGDAANGEKLVAVCGACHGTEGNSSSDAFPKVAGLGEKYLYKQLQEIQSGAREVVEMAGQLDGKSEQELRDIAAFYASQTTQLSGAKEAKVRINAGIEVDALALGERIYRAGNSETRVPACSGCHSPRGLGNAPAGYPRISGQHAAYIQKQLENFRDGKRTNDGDAMVMRGATKQLSNAEIEAVANYISGLH